MRPVNHSAQSANGAGGGSGESSAGSPVSVRQLVVDHHAMIYRLAFRLTGNQADAEDVAQQTFLQAQQNLHQLRTPENPVPWLCAIARSCWMKSHRRRRPVSAAAIELNVDEVPQPLAEDDEFDFERLQSALDELPPEYKLVVTMFYFEEASYKEIAEQLEIPIGTVMSRLARAKGQLRKRLVDAVPEVVASEEPCPSVESVKQ
jgi:RNA polymerase sigma-70 factor (ECF subfamily)